MKTKKKIVRSVKGRFVPGVCPNPEGRPKGATSVSMDTLRKAIQNVEKRKHKDIYEHFVEQAFKDKYVLVALMKKLIPDLKAISVEGSLDRGGMTEEEAKQISQVFKERFKAIIHAQSQHHSG
jgi:hypothetical protein